MPLTCKKMNCECIFVSTHKLPMEWEIYAVGFHYLRMLRHFIDLADWFLIIDSLHDTFNWFTSTAILCFSRRATISWTWPISVWCTYHVTKKFPCTVNQWDCFTVYPQAADCTAQGCMVWLPRYLQDPGGQWCFSPEERLSGKKAPTFYSYAWLKAWASSTMAMVAWHVLRVCVDGKWSIK